ncbi:hypothetical protein BIU97_15070 [Curtobacterium sp. MCBA15_009]|uniref:hypothetical protein n=2 Tax=Curtobacterium TaxID=2034 RepID=UPI0008DCA7C4|nr:MULTISPECIES: hypothetical protein [unclassified Curtobacterium]OIH96619.1 hypothetical protein BIU92_16280 [Curtobacterium sp. MCBA15_003]OII15245.1 hypothetical protein BIU97_15070 [Curtobacterium sp. MCBA15_009]OII33258.1 hypothetical protein BIU94_14925 [Curtobacterium sp. MMLR14_006]
MASSMSSTPLFDSIAHRHDHPQAGSAPSRPQPASAPTSPLSAPVRAGDSTLVPAALVAAIDGIPERVASTIATELTVRPEQLVLVETVADAITRAIVDAVVTELDRIARDGVVRV